MAVSEREPPSPAPPVDCFQSSVFSKTSATRLGWPTAAVSAFGRSASPRCVSLKGEESRTPLICWRNAESDQTPLPASGGTPPNAPLGGETFAHTPISAFTALLGGETFA